MSYDCWKHGAANAQKGYTTPPQQPAESATAFKDRVAGAAWANRPNGK